MAYRVKVAPAARRQIRKLSKTAQRTIVKLLEELAEEPRQSGVKKLTGEENLYRARTGDYRVIYSIDDTERVVLVLKVGHRGEVYR